MNREKTVSCIRARSSISVCAQFGPRLHLAWHQPFGDITVTNVTGEGQTAFLGFGLAAGWWFTPAWGLTTGADGPAFARSLVAQLGVEHQF